MNMNNTLMAAAVFAVCASIAQAAPPSDTNGDGLLSFEEIQATNPQASPERFAARDTNGDGLLDREEMFAGRPEGRGRPEHRDGPPPWRRIDSNDDGVVSLEEMQTAFPEASGERFAALDTDGDGSLSPDELAAGRPPRGEGRRGRGPNIDTDGDGNISLAEVQASGRPMSAERFNELDTNGDGYLNRDEMPRPREMVQRLDTDGSGGLSLEEIQTRQPQMTAERFNSLDSNGDGQLQRNEMASARRQFMQDRFDQRGEFGGGFRGRPQR